MAKATAHSIITPKQNLATTIAGMIKRWGELDRVGRQLAGKVRMNDREHRQLSSNVDEQSDIACRIVATPAMTPDDRAAKLRFIRRSACAEWNRDDLFDMILKLDGERVARSPRRKNGAAVTEAPTAAV